jgi:hypothetical protein
MQVCDARVGADMTEKIDANSLDAALLDWDDRLQKYSASARSNGVALYVPDLRHGRSGQASGTRRQVRQGVVRPQKRAPDYRVVAAWGALMVLIGAGFWVFGTALHNQAPAAQQQAERHQSIYYCSTGVETPPFEPCKDTKDQRDI